MSVPVTDCCGAKYAQGYNDGGAFESYCRDCDEVVCTACCGLDESEEHMRLWCKPCTEARAAKRASINSADPRHEGL